MSHCTAENGKGRTAGQATQRPRGTCPQPQQRRTAAHAPRHVTCGTGPACAQVDLQRAPPPPPKPTRRAAFTVPAQRRRVRRCTAALCHAPCSAPIAAASAPQQALQRARVVSRAPTHPALAAACIIPRVCMLVGRDRKPCGAEPRKAGRVAAPQHTASTASGARPLPAPHPAFCSGAREQRAEASCATIRRTRRCEEGSERATMR